MNMEELQRIKIEKEIAQLENEIRTNTLKEYRNWLTFISIIAAIVVSSIGAYQTLAEIRNKERQFAMESIIRSHDIFVNQVLDRISAVKSQSYIINENGKMIEKSRETYGLTTQRGASVAAVSLAKTFRDLRGPTKNVLEVQLKTASSDPIWADEAKYLQKLLDELNKLPE
jgi:hypothetical protein